MRVGVARTLGCPVTPLSGPPDVWYPAGVYPDGRAAYQRRTAGGAPFGSVLDRKAAARASAAAGRLATFRGVPAAPRVAKAPRVDTGVGISGEVVADGVYWFVVIGLSGLAFGGC